MNALVPLLMAWAVTFHLTTAAAADVLEGALISGSGRLLAYSLQDKDLPADAATASERVILKSGYGQQAGVAKSRIQIRPFLRYDGNLNGGMPSDSLSIGALSFLIPDDYQAVSGPLAGLSVEALHVRALGNGLSLNLRGGASLGVALGKELQKRQAIAEGCISQRMTSVFFVHGCLMASWQKWKLGKSAQISAQAGAVHLFSFRKVRNQVTAEIRQEYLLPLNNSDEEVIQTLASLELLSALPNGAAMSLELEIGEAIIERSALRNKISAGYTRKIFDQPTSFLISLQKNYGGSFLGVPRHDETVSASIKRPIGDSMIVTLGGSRFESTADILDNFSLDITLSWKL